MAFVQTHVPSSTEDNYYSVLGVAPTARLIEIKKAFRALQRKAHPDSSRSDATRSVSAKLNEAYQVLSNALSRLEYDLEHGFKEKNNSNLCKLQEFKKRRAQKIRENMTASAARSRDIESNVTSMSPSNGTRVKNCGLIITKAKYGLIDMEQQQRVSLLNNSNDTNTDNSNSNLDDTMPISPYKLIRSNTVNLHQKRSRSKRHSKRKNSNDKNKENVNEVNSGYDSATESVSNNNNNMNESKNRKRSSSQPVEFTIDVTDALQCMVTHRGQSGGYIEIDDNVDKSSLDGFYDPCPQFHEHEIRYLEVEYMFNRKYHYVKVNNVEYLILPNQSHIVHIFDPKNSFKHHTANNPNGALLESDEEDQDTDDAKTESVTSIQNKRQSIPNHPRMPSFTGSSPLSPGQSNTNLKNNGRYSVILAATSAIQPAGMSGEVIMLPSGKAAIQERPSLAGLKKFSEIEKLRKEQQGKGDETQQADERDGKIWMDRNTRNRIIQWSVGLMIIGAIGGLGYYYVDKIQRKSHAQNENNNNKPGNNSDGSLASYLWQESVIAYIQKYWNWMMGIKPINDDNDNTKYNVHNKKADQV